MKIEQIIKKYTDIFNSVDDLNYVVHTVNSLYAPEEIIVLDKICDWLSTQSQYYLRFRLVAGCVRLYVGKSRMHYSSDGVLYFYYRGDVEEMAFIMSTSPLQYVTYSL